MGLTKIAITRPIFIFMLMAAAILLGTLAFFSMRLEENPDVEVGTITVTTPYPGADPDTIATLVSKPIEDSLSGLNGLNEVTSTSLEGASVVVANFFVGTDMVAALNDVRSKVDGVRGELPNDALDPIVEKFDISGEPVLTMALSSDTLDQQELRDLADDKLTDRFARISGVASVGVSGGDQREIQIQLRSEKLKAYGLGINDVQRSIAAATLNLPAGRIVDGERELAVRVPAEFESLQEIEDMRVYLQDPNSMRGEGYSVRLGEIATVVDTTAERRRFSRLNGSDSVQMVVQKAKEGNAVEISKAAEKVIDQIEEDYGLSITMVRDTSIRVEESLLDLGLALFIGIFLVTAIVYLFLHNIRGTIIVGIAIPVCLLATFVVLWAMGFTLNTMSMLALSLAIGVLVDDCIVVLENIYRHLRMGEDPVEAAINGRGEIGLAAIAITLADVVVFIPIAFMDGVVGQFFRPLGIGFAVAVLLSLFVSFTVTPMLAARWYRQGEDWEHPTGRFAQWFERSFNRLAELYRRGLEWSLRHRWFVFLSGFVSLIAVFAFIAGSFAPSVQGAAMGPMPMTLFVFCTIVGALVFIGNLFRGYVKPRLILSGAMFGLVFPIAALIGFQYHAWKGDAVFKFAFFPPSDQGAVQVNIELPPGASLAATEEVVKFVESRVIDHPDAKFVTAQIGSRSSGFGAGDQGANYAQVQVTLHEKSALLDSIMFWVKHDEPLRTRSDTAVAADLLDSIGKVPGAKVQVSTLGGFGGGADIQMSFVSNDRERLEETVQTIQRRLAAGEVPGLINVELSSKPGKPEARVMVDRTRLGDFGLSAFEVASAMRTLYEGNNDVKYRDGGREYDIRVMMDPAERNNPAILETVPIAFRQGQPITLPQLASVEEGSSVDKIERRNRTEEIQLLANLLPGYAAGSVQAQIDQWIQNEGLLAEGVETLPLGQAQVQQQESGYLLTALLLGLVLVYMLLASLFDNLLYPFIVQLSQPQAMVGALLALIITDKTLNIVGFVGIIALVGLVGKNAILLVDYANTLRARGRNRHDALVEAGPVRLKPIMMTTLAVLGGMLPVALAIGRGSEFRETIGITIIGGITLSTLLTLFVIPCSYTIFDDLSNSFGRLLRRGGRGAAPGADEPGLTPPPVLDPEPEEERV